MQQLFIINPAAGKTDASVVLVPPQPAGKKYISTRQAATAR